MDPVDARIKFLEELYSAAKSRHELETRRVESVENKVHRYLLFEIAVVTAYLTLSEKLQLVGAGCLSVPIIIAFVASSLVSIVSFSLALYFVSDEGLSVSERVIREAAAKLDRGDAVQEYADLIFSRALTVGSNAMRLCDLTERKVTLGAMGYKAMFVGMSLLVFHLLLRLASKG